MQKSVGTKKLIHAGITQYATDLFPALLVKFARVRSIRNRTSNERDPMKNNGRFGFVSRELLA
jgi:hypothetical protein